MVRDGQMLLDTLEAAARFALALLAAAVDEAKHAAKRSAKQHVRTSRSGGLGEGVLSKGEGGAAEGRVSLGDGPRLGGPRRLCLRRT
jgi:hypothetical protein